MSKIYEFQNIEPKEVLSWFKKICSIPHGSFKEKAVATMLKAELEKAGAKVEMLSSGALYIKQKATFGHDDWPSVLLQGHMDMVLVKDSDCDIDLDTQPIRAYYDEENKWLKAEGTTLGADNGVALAMFMEIITNPKIEHGPIEGLFTVGEEVDTSLCMNSIKPGLLKSKYYINLDSDHDDTIFHASAGVYRVEYKLPLNYSKADDKKQTYEITLNNFSGGHSALVIHNPHINPIVLMCRVLLNFSNEVEQVGLISLDGGLAHNSIPTFAKAKVQVSESNLNKLEKYFDEQLTAAKVAAQNNEQNGIVTISKIEQTNKVLDSEQTNHICLFYAAAPNGMLTMFNNVGCMFNTSNIGLVKTNDDHIASAFLPRSFYEPDLKYLAKLLVEYAKQNGAIDIKSAPSCSGWLVQNPEESFLIQLWKQNYKKVVGKEPKILPNPGGLEVAEIVKKSPQMIPNSMSAGPIIFKEHSTLENCPVDSIKRIWEILKLTLKGLNK